MSPPTNTRPEETYTYSPLPTPTSIRLLQIDPSTPSPVSIISCTLTTVDLSANPKPQFYALSYTWGNPFPGSNRPHLSYAEDEDGRVFVGSDEGGRKYAGGPYGPESRHEVLVNGRKMEVTRNLYEALGVLSRGEWVKRLRWRRTWRAERSETGVEPVSVTGTGDRDVQERAVENGGRVCKAARDGILTEESQAQERGKGSGQGAERSRRSPREDLETVEMDSAAIWVDALCIDQSNPLERSAQVSIMDQIYHSATSVIVWLGASDSYTLPAIRVLQKLDSIDPQQILKSGIIPYTQQPESVYHDAGVPYISWGEWKALAALYSRQYFRRLWVVQEVILAQDILIFCGNLRIFYDQLCTATLVLEARQSVLGLATSTIFIPKHEIGMPLEQPLKELIQWSNCVLHPDGALAKQTAKRFDLTSLVFDTWTFLASEPRDNIFGLYGLLRLTAPKAPEWKPDYGKGTDRVFAEATRRMVIEAGELRILSAIQDRSVRITGTRPSWTPDFSFPYVNMMAAIFSTPGSLPFSAPKEPDDGIPNSWATLRIQGGFFDTVTALGSSRVGPESVADWTKLDPRWLELTLLLPTPYHDGQPRTEALWRTLCANQDSRRATPAPAHFATLFKDILCSMVHAAAMEEARRPDAGMAGVAPSLEAAVERVRDFWGSESLSSMSKDDLVAEFGTEERNMSGPRQQLLTYSLFKLECLLRTEEGCAVPGLGEIETLGQRLPGGCGERQRGVETEFEAPTKGRHEGDDVTGRRGGNGPEERSDGPANCEGQGEKESEDDGHLGNPRDDEARTTRQGRTVQMEVRHGPTADQNNQTQREVEAGMPGGENWVSFSRDGTLRRPRDSGFATAFLGRYGRRRLFVTKKRYMGLGPASMKVRDEIWILPGAGAAFVLRRVGDERPQGREGKDERSTLDSGEFAGEAKIDEGRADYIEANRQHDEGETRPRERLEVIGEAYVHGIMNGEATKFPEFRLQDIDLV